MSQLFMPTASNPFFNSQECEEECEPCEPSAARRVWDGEGKRERDWTLPKSHSARSLQVSASHYQISVVAVLSIVKSAFLSVQRSLLTS